MNIDNFTENDVMKNRSFKDLRLNKSCLDNNTFFNFKSPDPMRGPDGDNRMFETGFTPNLFDKMNFNQGKSWFLQLQKLVYQVVAILLELLYV